MKDYSTSMLRNVSILAHGGAGKTTLTEAMLFSSGTTTRVGKVEDGSTTTDYEPEEIKRKVSISSALAPLEWKGHKVNLLDTPGYFDFIAEVISSFKAVEGCLITVCASAGVEVGTEKAWSFAKAAQLPRLIFINKMDRENANYFDVLLTLKQKFGNNIAPIQMPIGAEHNFCGIIDLLQLQAIIPANKLIERQPIPEDLLPKALELRQSLIEIIAETDDNLLDRYLNGNEISPAELTDTFYKATTQAKIFPVLCGSASKNIGINELLNAVVNCIPAPGGMVSGFSVNGTDFVERRVAVDQPFSAHVFKTTTDPYVGRLTYLKILSGILQADSTVYNPNQDKMERFSQVLVLRGKQQLPVSRAVAGDIAVVAKLQHTQTGDTLCDKEKAIKYEPAVYPQPMFKLAVEAKNKNDEDKIGGALHRLMDEDPTFRLEKDVSSGQTLISGMGELHLDIISEKLKRKFGVDIKTSSPKVPYRETIRMPIKVEGKHKKQSGGHGQYGHVWLRLEPGNGFEFSEEIFGGSVPRQYIPAVEKGVREAMQAGVLAGYPMVDIKTVVYDGSYHSVDSSEMAFKLASQLAFRKGVLQAKPALLEPIYNVEVRIPEQCMGDIIGDFNTKRGKIMGMENVEEGLGVVKAQVPLAELFRYAIHLRSLTQSRGEFSIEFSHYEDVPPRIAEEIIASSKQPKIDDV